MPRTCRGAVLYAVLLGVVCGAAPGRAADPPLLLFSGLLNGIRLDYQTGAFDLDRMQALNLPAPPEGAEYAPEGGAKLWAMLSTVQGGQLTPQARFDLAAEPAGGAAWMVSTVWAIDLKTQEKDFGGRTKVAPGDYVLEFFLASGKFYRFPFTVTALPSPGADQPGEWFFLEGAWADWGYLFYAGAKPEEALQWKMWLRNRSRMANMPVRIALEVRADRDNKVIATGRPDYTYGLSPSWVRLACDLIHPMVGTSGGAFFTAAELLKADGAYTLTVTMNGQPYAKWGFSVAGGKLVPARRTVRDETDPLDFVEGGVDAFWYERTKPVG